MDLKTAEKLARLRKEHGYSQEELAEKLRVSRQAVSKWERGESSPDTDNLIALAILYGISLDEMLSFDGTNKKSKEDRREHAEKGTEDERVKEFFSVRTDSGEEVHIGRDGLHVDDGKGTRVQIAPFKINVTNANKDGFAEDSDEDGRYSNSAWEADCEYGSHRDKSYQRYASDDEPVHGKHCGRTTVNINGVPIFTKGKHGASPSKCAAVGTLHGITFFATVAAFLLWGFLGGENGAWKYSWLVWFALPTVSSFIEAIAYKDAKKFAYPVLVTGIYLTIGMYLGLWHPGWVLFVSIPFYYFIVDFLRAIMRNAR